MMLGGANVVIGRHTRFNDCTCTAPTVPLRSSESSCYAVGLRPLDQRQDEIY